MSIDIFREIQADLWVFDNDGTLYDPKNVESAINHLMIKFIAEHYKISIENAKIKRKELQERHQTKYTLIALAEEGINQNEFIKKTYLNINPRRFGVSPNSSLIKILSSIKGEKIILTNNPSEFARSILKSLEIEKYFSKIIGMNELNFVLKPEYGAFDFINSYLKDNKRVVFIDDDPKNIVIAKKIGCTTMLADKNCTAEKSADYQISLLS